MKSWVKWSKKGVRDPLCSRSFPEIWEQLVILKVRKMNLEVINMWYHQSWERNFCITDGLKNLFIRKIMSTESLRFWVYPGWKGRVKDNTCVVVQIGRSDILAVHFDWKKRIFFAFWRGSVEKSPYPHEACRDILKAVSLDWPEYEKCLTEK